MAGRFRFKKFMVVSLMAFLMIGGFVQTAFAQGKFPNRALTIICPWAAGGGTDAIARMVAFLMEKDLGQPINVVNRTGGSGAVGHTAAATSSPDGYTMCITTMELTMMHWLGLAQVSYKDVRGVGLINFDPAGINVAANAPWKTVKELQDYAKANQGKLKASGTGKGGSWDLARAGWLKAAGLSIDSIPWVPSNGAAPALQELLAGGYQIVTCSLPEARALIEAKKVKVLAIMADKRADLFPDVPTLKEQGINWSMGVWRSITVPKATPTEIVAVLEKSLEKAVASDQYKKFMKDNGYGILWKPAAEFDNYLASEDAGNGALLKEAGITK